MPAAAARPVPSPTRMPSSTRAAAASPAASHARLASAPPRHGRLCDDPAVQEVAPGIAMIDTLLGGHDRGSPPPTWSTATAPALVDPGARTSAPAVRAALADAGLGPDDLALDRADPRPPRPLRGHGHPGRAPSRGARVVVHERGARHLADPAPPGRRRRPPCTGTAGRSTAASTRTAAERIDAVERRARGRPRRRACASRMIATPGHARHHMSVLDEWTGTVLAGDAVGVRMRGGGLYPALPPPEIDPAGGRRQPRAGSPPLAPAVLCLVPLRAGARPRRDDRRSRERQLALVAEAALAHARPAPTWPRAHRRRPAARGGGRRPGRARPLAHARVGRGIIDGLAVWRARRSAAAVRGGRPLDNNPERFIVRMT